MTSSPNTSVQEADRRAHLRVLQAQRWPDKSQYSRGRRPGHPPRFNGSEGVFGAMKGMLLVGLLTWLLSLGTVFLSAKVPDVKRIAVDPMVEVMPLVDEVRVLGMPPAFQRGGQLWSHGFASEWRYPLHRAGVPQDLPQSGRKGNRSRCRDICDFRANCIHVTTRCQGGESRSALSVRHPASSIRRVLVLGACHRSTISPRSRRS